jgi:adenine phosphoribosyltransferase
MAKEQLSLAQYIRAIPDWPKKGILFRDITPLLADPRAFPAAVEALCEPFKRAGVEFVAGVEARGFIFGAAVAAKLRAGFVPMRKKGKLPCQTESATYALEYGTDCIEMHRDTIPAGAKVLLVDDLLATGGTAAAAIELVRKLGGEPVGAAFAVELSFLNGRSKLPAIDVFSLLKYDK